MRELTNFVPAAVLLTGVLLVSGVREQLKMPSRAPMKAVTLDAPGYATGDIVVPEEERKIAGMSDYVMRSYTKDSLDVFSIYVGYYDYQTQGKTIHSPKNCLPGAGWEQMQGGTVPVGAEGKQVQINRFLMANKGARALVYYWYQGRGRVEANEYKVKWNLLRDAAIYGRTDEALVRIVIPLPASRPGIDNQTDPRVLAADRQAVSLAGQLVSRVDQVLPPIDS
ncbi:MAG: EpsI family protein [Gemmatimonadaceae bacterium]|jgi:EpsI family protein|nr:EpsI family protein [Gemmatimonadaceae bacterium]